MLSVWRSAGAKTQSTEVSTQLTRLLEQSNQQHAQHLMSKLKQQKQAGNVAEVVQLTMQVVRLQQSLDKNLNFSLELIRSAERLDGLDEKQLGVIKTTRMRLQEQLTIEQIKGKLALE